MFDLSTLFGSLFGGEFGFFAILIQIFQTILSLFGPVVGMVVIVFLLNSIGGAV